MTATKSWKEIQAKNEPLPTPPAADRARLFYTAEVTTLKAEIHAMTCEAGGLKQQDQREVLAQVNEEIAFKTAQVAILQAGLDVTAPRAVPKPVQVPQGK